MKRTTTIYLASCFAAAIALTEANATVYFQNTGTTSGWTASNARNTAKITENGTYVYKGSTSLVHECNWAGSGTANHAEMMKYNAQQANTTRYYGQAIRLPSDWVYRDANITFQQFTHEQNVSGAWIMNWVDIRDIKIIFKGTTHTVGNISAGTWNRLVVRLSAAPSASGGGLEYWWNGTKTMSVMNVGNLPPNGATSIRWSSGIYVTYWRNATTLPGGDTPRRAIYHDHHRIASSYNEANPSSW